MVNITVVVDLVTHEWKKTILIWTKMTYKFMIRVEETQNLYLKLNTKIL